MRSPKKRSLLIVNEHFEGKHNDKIYFYSLSKRLPFHNCDIIE